MEERRGGFEHKVSEVPFSFSWRSYPLNPSATVSFTLEDAQEVTLRIFDVYGRLLHTIFENVPLRQGFHEIHLYGETVPVGGCYARLHTRHGVQQRTLLRMTDAL